MVQRIEVEIWGKKEEVDFSVSCERARSGDCRWTMCVMDVVDDVDVAIGSSSGDDDGRGEVK